MPSSPFQACAPLFHWWPWHCYDPLIFVPLFLFSSCPRSPFSPCVRLSRCPSVPSPVPSVRKSAACSSVPTACLPVSAVPFLVSSFSVVQMLSVAGFRHFCNYCVALVLIRLLLILLASLYRMKKLRYTIIMTCFFRPCPCKR